MRQTTFTEKKNLVTYFELGVKYIIFTLIIYIDAPPPITIKYN